MCKMISNIDDNQGEEEEIITTEYGELLRLEPRNGKRVAARTPRKAGGNEAAGKSKCHGFGRAGHFRRDCTWS